MRNKKDLLRWILWSNRRQDCSEGVVVRLL